MPVLVVCLLRAVFDARGYVSLSSVGEHDKAQEHLEDKDNAAFVLVGLLHVFYIHFDLEIIDKLNVISIGESMMCY